MNWMSGFFMGGLRGRRRQLKPTVTIMSNFWSTYAWMCVAYSDGSFGTTAGGRPRRSRRRRPGRPCTVLVVVLVVERPDVGDDADLEVRVVPPADRGRLADAEPRRTERRSAGGGRRGRRRRAGAAAATGRDEDGQPANRASPVLRMRMCPPRVRGPNRPRRSADQGSLRPGTSRPSRPTAGAHPSDRGRRAASGVVPASCGLGFRSPTPAGSSPA